MINLHQEIISLSIAYTLTGAFIFTVVVTCLSLIGWVKFADKSQQKKLFTTLIVELVTICIAFFSGFLEFNPKDVQKTIVKENQILAAHLLVNGLTVSESGNDQRQYTINKDTFEKNINEIKSLGIKELNDEIDDVEKELQKVKPVNGQTTTALGLKPENKLLQASKELKKEIISISAAHGIETENLFK